MTTNEEHQSRFERYQLEVPPTRPAGVQVPDGYGYIQYKAYWYLDVGPEKYRQEDFFHFPPAHWSEERLSSVSRGCGQILRWRGISQECPLEGIGTQGFHDLLQVFHFKPIRHSGVESGDGWVIEIMQMRHAMGTAAVSPTFDEITFFNKAPVAMSRLNEPARRFLGELDSIGAMTNCLTSETQTLRDLIRWEFEMDLPIYGGSGERKAPIVITSPNLHEAADVQMRVLRCLGTGRGVAWRSIEQEVVDPKRGTVRVDIETIQITEQEATAQKEGCYFVLEALPTDVTARQLPEPTGFDDLRSGFRLPYQLGWLHFQGTRDYESQSPGLGSSAVFRGPGVTATVYVYASAAPPEASDRADSGRVVEEFRSAVSDVLKINTDSSVLSSQLVSGSSGTPCFALAVCGYPEDRTSWVFLTTRDGFFVKGRVTCQRKEARIREMAQESIVAIMNAIHPDAAITSLGDEAANPIAQGDPADQLLNEFHAWYLKMADAGKMPRAFTGVTVDGRQFVVVLDGLGFDHVQYRQFLVWLCKRESIASYAYARPIQKVIDPDSEAPELQMELAICASSAARDAELTMEVHETESGSIRYGEAIWSSQAAGETWRPLAGLQREDAEFSPDEEHVFDDLWQQLREAAFWPRQ